MRLDYRTEEFQKVSVCGILCDFSDMRIDRSTYQKTDISMKLPMMMRARENRQE